MSSSGHEEACLGGRDEAGATQDFSHPGSVHAQPHKGLSLSARALRLSPWATPARAGSTTGRGRFSTATGDHPRACGEHGSQPTAATTGEGPPPRVRGAHAVGRRLTGPRGTTPARAGSTVPRSGVSAILWDHPRACGEHPRTRLCANCVAGPPPRVRGAHGLLLRPRFAVGTTPARAGSTAQFGRPSMKARDHPRACGEHDLGHLRLPLSVGPPPRVRGARGRADGTAVGVGTTPARAGSTTITVSSPPAARDHPRACGEHTPIATLRCVAGGPPPRVRGALFLTCTPTNE